MPLSRELSVCSGERYSVAQRKTAQWSDGRVVKALKSLHFGCDNGGVKISNSLDSSLRGLLACWLSSRMSALLRKTDQND